MQGPSQVGVVSRLIRLTDHELLEDVDALLCRGQRLIVPPDFVAERSDLGEASREFFLKIADRRMSVHQQSAVCERLLIDLQGLGMIPLVKDCPHVVAAQGQ